MSETNGTSADEADLFQRDLDRHMQDPEFRRSYEEQTRRLEVNTGGAMSEVRLAELEGVVGSRSQPMRMPILVTREGRELLAEVRRSRAAEKELRADRDAATARAVQAEAEADRLRALIADEHSQLSQDLDNAEEVVRLEAELAQVRESHQLSEAQLVEVTLERAEWRKQAQKFEIVAKVLRADLVLAASKTDTAEQGLAKLRERIGDESVQWGVRYTAGVDGAGMDCSEEDDPVDYCDDQADATQLAAHTPGAIPVWHLRGEWKVAGNA